MTAAWRAFERRFLLGSDENSPRDELNYFLSLGTLAMAALLGVLFAMQYAGFPGIVGGLRGIVFPLSFLVVYVMLRRGYRRSVGAFIVAAVLGLLYSQPPLVVAGTIVAYAIVVTGLTESPRAMFITAAVSPLVLLHASHVLAGENYLVPVTVSFSNFAPEWFDEVGAGGGFFLPNFGGTVAVCLIFASTTFYLLRRVEAAAAAKATYEAANKANEELGRLNNELEHRATHDSLTDLANRSAFMGSIEAAIDRCGRDGERLALMFVDLDDFKAVNDAGGHDTGDRLLRLVAARLGTTLDGMGAEIARLGGDEFVVYLTDDPDEETAVTVGRTILETLTQPFALQGKEIRIGCSIGVALFPDHAESASDLLRRADRAMYAAKHAGKRRLELASPVVTDGT